MPVPVHSSLPTSASTAQLVERAHSACRRSLRLRLETMLLLHRLELGLLDLQLEEHLREVERAELGALSRA